METIKITDDSFEIDVLKSNKVIVVDFWAKWCGPCKQISYILEEIANELKGTISIAKINIDENPDTPTKFGVRSIPTLLIFKNGELKATKVGILPKTKIIKWIKENL